MQKFLRFIVLLFAFAAATASATDRPASASQQFEPINRSSPRETYQSFLAATARIEQNYAGYIADKSPDKVLVLRRELKRVRELLDLENLPPATRAKTGSAAVGYLYDILARLPPLDPASIPGPGPEGIADPQKLPAKWTIPGTDIQIARTESGPYAGDYQFTAGSVANLPEYYLNMVDHAVINTRLFPHFHREQISATGPLIPDSIVRNLPAFLGVYYFNTPLWKILAIAVIILAFFLVVLVWARIALRFSRRHTSVLRLGWRLSIPVCILLMFSISEWLIGGHINPAGSFAASESLFSTAVYYTTGAWASWLLVYFVVESIISSPRIPENSYDAHLLRLIARILALLSAGIILVNGANEMGIPALGLVAGLGVGGFALALASQSTIENLFGGLSLFADRPFRVGDRIRFDKQTARVERIGPRSSRLRARDGALCTVPNADLAKMHIVNYSMRDRCYLLQVFALRGDSDPEQIRQFLEHLRVWLNEEPTVEKDKGWPNVKITGVSNGHIDIRVRANVLTSEYHLFLDIQERFLLSALLHMRQLGLELALPMDFVPAATAQDTRAAAPPTTNAKGNRLLG